MSKETKQKLGQFYTTNFKYILQNINIPDDIENIIEPFCGKGDLLKFIGNINDYKIECYDIDPKKDIADQGSAAEVLALWAKFPPVKKDTLKNPPDYNNKFIITNPPYLARNKSKDKEIFDKYDVNDLYKCFIKEIITNECLGGILIIPLNFWSSIRKNDIELRKLFLEKYNVIQLNIFEEQVFDDTTTTVCSFQYTKKINDNDINITIYPSKLNITTKLNNENNYLIGGDIYNLKTKKIYKINRITNKNKTKEKDNITNILIKCIDDNEENKIGLSIVEDKDIYIDKTPNQSSRTYASLIIKPKISLEKQKIIVDKCNTFINNHRKQYNSLFLSNYRESKDIARKRISFDLIYQIVEYFLDNDS